MLTPQGPLWNFILKFPVAYIPLPRVRHSSRELNYLEEVILLHLRPSDMLFCLKSSPCSSSSGLHLSSLLLSTLLKPKTQESNLIFPLSTLLHCYNLPRSNGKSKNTCPSINKFQWAEKSIFWALRNVNVNVVIGVGVAWQEVRIWELWPVACHCQNYLRLFQGVGSLTSSLKVLSPSIPESSGSVQDQLQLIIVNYWGCNREWRATKEKFSRFWDVSKTNIMMMDSLGVRPDFELWTCWLTLTGSSTSLQFLCNTELVTCKVVVRVKLEYECSYTCM